MALRINTNIQSLAAQRHLTQNGNNLNGSIEKLASGSRINRAGDDAAGLAISEKIKSHIRSMEQANRNANDGISMIQTAEGAFNEISTILNRLRELSIQTASDTVGQVERGFVDKEVQHLLSEVDRIADTTEFNNIRLLDGSSEVLDFHIGLYDDAVNDQLHFDTSELTTNLESLGLGGIGVLDKSQAVENLAPLDQAIEQINESRSSMGALQNRMESSIRNMEVYQENISAANSRIRDTDMAKQSSELTKYNVLSNTNVAMLVQANQNASRAQNLLG